MAILKQYLALCWFQSNPLTLPRSVDFFKQNFWFYYIVEYFIQVNMVDDPVESFYEVSLETALTFLFIGIMLILNRSLYVFIQASTAFLFCENVVAIFVVPVIVWLTTTDDALSYYTFAALALWQYALIAYLIQRILSINLVAALVLSFLYFIVTYGGAFALAQVI
ncbi:hypothetical protein [Methylobacter sp.]|uniref:hypothetical protein n=1 Tax=Methylobacter sp. TaxID=2051955 RepID=UPI003DA506AE